LAVLAVLVNTAQATGRGVHFALTPEQYTKVIELASDDKLIDFIHFEIEEEWDRGSLRESDKAWDAIHRSLTDGKLEWENGTFPLNAVILGGKQLYKGDDYIVSLVTPDQVLVIAKALKQIDKVALKKGYDQITQGDYDGEVGENDFEYTWGWFKDLHSLYEKAVQSNRAMLFTVDQ